MRDENEIVIVLRLDEPQTPERITAIGFDLGRAVEVAMHEHFGALIGEVTVSARRGLRGERRGLAGACNLR